MKKTLITALFVFAAMLTQAQTVARSVIGSCGESFVNANGSIQWTIGETAVETYSSSSNFVTQGFQQPDANPTGITEQHATIDLDLFPNPATDHVTLQFGADASGEYVVEVFNALGQQLSSQAINVTSGSRSDISVSTLADGIYFVSVRKVNSNASTSFKINKIS
jgi:Secretion system C-terminal sorting domain